MKQHQAELNIQPEAERNRRAGQQARDEQSAGNGRFAGSERALGLPWVRAIGMQIEQIIDDIDARGAQAEQQKSERGVPQRAKSEAVSQQQRQEQQRILHPVMNAQRAQPGLQRSGLALNHSFHASDAPHFAHQLLVAYDIRRAAILPDRQIRLRIADVVIATFPELLAEKSRLCLTFEVLAVARPVNEIEKPKVLGDLFGQ